MAANLPARYQLEIRLGRDGDVEEWLATDLTLDRPVLVRLLGPEVATERRNRFLAEARSLASVTHPHLLEVYAAGSDDDHTWMIAEWTGGVTIADRIRAGTPMPAEEFLPNAAGLAEALAALHAQGVVHGSIEPGTVSFAAAHPAKLMTFARANPSATARGDVADLARTLEAALSGSTDELPPPSQLTDAIHRSVDATLAAAEGHELTAAEFAARLQSAPGGRRQPKPSSWSWRWVIPAALVVLVGMIITVAGPFRPSEDTAPFALPAPSTTTTRPATTTTTSVPAPRAIVVDVLDPSEDGERDAELPYLTDGDPATGWRTEQYFAPITLLKPGVGVTFVLDRDPSSVSFDASVGTAYEIRWAATQPDTLDGWEILASGRVAGDQAQPFATTDVALPPRTGGFWLLWLTDLALQGQSDDDPPRDFFYTFVYEVRFTP